MLKAFTDDEVKVVYDLTKSVFEKNFAPFNPLTKAQILQDLETSRSQMGQGEYMDLEEAVDMIEKKYTL